MLKPPHLHKSLKNLRQIMPAAPIPQVNLPLIVALLLALREVLWSYTVCFFFLMGLLVTK